MWNKWLDWLTQIKGAAAAAVDAGWISFLALESEEKGYGNLQVNPVVTVPFPTMLHATGDTRCETPAAAVSSSDSSSESTAAMSSSAVSSAASTSPRRYFLSYVGRARWPAAELNTAVGDEAVYKHHVFASNGWSTTVDDALQTSILRYHLASTFVLQPYGDMATRRGFYDCLIAGAIPVIFESNRVVYADLFRGQAIDVDRMAVTVPNNAGAFRSNGMSQKGRRRRRQWAAAARDTAAHIIGVLKAVSAADIDAMRAYTRTHVRALQYSLHHDAGDALSLGIKAVRAIGNHRKPVNEGARPYAARRAYNAVKKEE
jgi:hypothetical protein